MTAETDKTWSRAGMAVTTQQLLSEAETVAARAATARSTVGYTCKY